tara:strand:+ start:3423 stop:3683 length:261 start_codon:yes stop_codon:yes gene_type:complete
MKPEELITEIGGDDLCECLTFNEDHTRVDWKTTEAKVKRLVKVVANYRLAIEGWSPSEVTGWQVETEKSCMKAIRKAIKQARKLND